MNKILTPVYQCAYEKLNQLDNDEKFIFHYTTAEGLLGIIKSMYLRVSSFSNSNDLNEANIRNAYKICRAEDISKIESFIEEKCRYISFVENRIHGFVHFEGINHPRMWAQYAQNGEGACIVINEKRFLRINKTILKNKFYDFKRIKYRSKNSVEGEKQDYTDSESLIKRYYKEIFYKKHNDWRGENEKRFWGIDLPKEFSIYGAIEFICLGHNFVNNASHMNDLLDIISDSSSPFYNYLRPASFTEIKPYEHGYLECASSSPIERWIKKWEKYKNYYYSNNEKT